MWASDIPAGYGKTALTFFLQCNNLCIVHVEKIEVLKDKIKMAFLS